MRKEALAWWKQLSAQEKSAKVQDHFPDRPFIFVATSTSYIEKIFKKEFETKK